MNINTLQKYVLPLGFLVAVFLPRLIDLGTVLTVDEPLWLSRGQTFIQGFSVGNFEKTLVAGQPGVTTAWLVGLSAPWASLTAGQIAIATTSGVLVLIITYFLRILIGKKWGLITGFFLALDPFLIAHSRIVHTDALLSLFYLASITSLLCAVIPKTLHQRYVIMSAILAGAALLTKIFGLILIPTAVLIIIIARWHKKDDWARIARMVGLWISIFLITTFAAWPALWSNADKVFDYLFSRAELHGEGTRSEETTSASWYYARETFFRLSLPVALLSPFAIWQLAKKNKSKHAIAALYILGTGLFFIVALNTGSDKSDRYALLTHLTVATVAPLGLRGIVQTLKKRSNQNPWASLIIVIPILFLAVDAIRIHPYYLAHFNRLYPIEETHKLGWGEGLEQAALWIEDKHPGAKVLSYYPRVFSYFYKGEVETVTHINDAQGDYAVLYRSMFERGDGTPESDIVSEFINNKTKKLVRTITINGLPYVWIYEL